MSIPNHLVEKFFRGDCTEEEKRQVAAWLRDNPEKFAQYLTEDSWESFKPQPQLEVPTGKIRQSIENVIGKMDAEPEVHHEATVDMPVRKIRYSWVAAAAIIGAIALFFLLHKNKGDRTIPEIADSKPNRTQHQASLTHVDNTTAGTRTFILPDGSKVELSARTTITFDSAFSGSSRRAIILQQGEAVFTVKKDPRPFVVYSGGITTTALGTVFSVSDKQRLFTTVHLFSGKVVVKKAAGEKGGSFKDIYLKPGQQLAVNQEDFSIRIKNTLTPAPAAAAQPAPQNALDFANRPLGEILSILQKEYNVSISYDAAALQNMTFTGKLNRDKESLDSFLGTLCDLNDLILKKISENSFSIQVKQP